MKTVEQVNKEELKKHIATLNEFVAGAGKGVEGLKKVRTTAVTAGKMYDEFVNAVKLIGKANLGDQLPDDFILFFNSLFEAPPPEEAAPPDEGAEAGEEAPATEASEKPALAVEPETAPAAEAPKKRRGRPPTPKSAAPPKPRAPRKAPPGIKVPYNTFDELKAFLANPITPTNYMDKLLLEGGTFKDIVAKFIPYADSVQYKTLRSVNVLRGHVNYRISRGWMFEFAGAEGEAQSVRLVGYNPPPPKTAPVEAATG